MARRVQNNKGFLIIEMTPKEAIEICGFGWCGALVCDDCNTPINNNNYIYYIAVLSRVFCKECYEDWASTATRYDEDIDYETEKFEYYAKLLNLI